MRGARRSRSVTRHRRSVEPCAETAALIPADSAGYRVWRTMNAPIRFFLPVVVNGIIVWGAIRGSLVLLGVPTLARSASLAVIAIVCWVVLYDARRADRAVFLENLGTPAWQLGVSAAVPASLMELLIYTLA